MAFLCSELQVAVETESLTKPPGTQSPERAECCCLPPKTWARIELLFQSHLSAIGGPKTCSMLD